jgi:hypothetical protein
LIRKKKILEEFAKLLEEGEYIVSGIFIIPLVELGI